jgi:hypothetical protein
MTSVSITAQLVRQRQRHYLIRADVTGASIGLIELEREMEDGGRTESTAGRLQSVFIGL